MAKAASKKAATAKGSVKVELRTVAPKKNVVRFDTDAEGAAMQSGYVSKEAVEALGGCENGVRITIEAL